MSAKLLAMLLLVVLTCQGALAGQIVLKNGDRLTGTIAKADGKSLVIATELVGEVTVGWDAITTLQSEAPLVVTLADGRKATGVVSVADGRIEVRPADADPVVVETTAVDVVRSPEAQADYEHKLAPGWLDQWEGAADVGLSLTSGNSDTTTIASGVALSRQTTRDKMGVYLASLYTRDTTDEEDPRTIANAIRGGVRYDYNLNERLFGYGFMDIEHNTPQDLSLRLVLGGGLGYHAIRSERTQLDFFGGLAWNKEWFEENADRSSAEVQFGQSLSYKLGSRSLLKEQLVVFPNMSDGGEYRLNFDTAFITAITKRIGWHITVSDRYLSNPPPGLERNDLILTTGLTFKIGQVAGK